MGKLEKKFMSCAYLFQKESSEQIEANPKAYLNPDQPLISALAISDEEIKEQERRVNQARIKLAQAVKALG